MRTLTALLVPLFVVACGPGADQASEAETDLFDDVSPRQPAPRHAIPDSVSEALYQRVWDAVDPGDGYRDYRYLEFDRVVWRGVDILRRSHRYSPWERNFRVEVRLDGQDLVALGNWNSAEPTHVWLDGVEITGDSAVVLAQRAERMFEVDANALLFPYRWADPGMRVERLGPVTTQDGAIAQSVGVSFQGGGTTQPKYVFWVDPDTGLPIRSFSYLRQTDDEPNTVNDWLDWVRFGPLLLSTRRKGDGESEVRFENITIEDFVPEGRFTGPSN